MSFLCSSSSHFLQLTNSVDLMSFVGTSSVRQNVKKGSPRKIWNELTRKVFLVHREKEITLRGVRRNWRECWVLVAGAFASATCIQ